MKLSVPLMHIALLSAATCWCCPASAAPGVSAQAMPLAALTDQAFKVSGTPVAAWSVRDRHGDHVLVLTRTLSASRQQPNRQRPERTDLKASYLSHANGRWPAAWTIQDAVDCPGLDADAHFFLDHVTMTDLNGDGIAEVTVPYTLSCGGGIDTDTVKLIMRQGQQKLAVRGESLIIVPGAAPFGGKAVYDKALDLPQHAAYRRHLEDVWKKVAVRRYPG